MKFYLYGAIGFVMGAIPPFVVAWFGGWSGERSPMLAGAAAMAFLFGFAGMILGWAKAS